MAEPRTPVKADLVWCVALVLAVAAMPTCLWLRTDLGLTISVLGAVVGCVGFARQWDQDTDWGHDHMDYR